MLAIVFSFTSLLAAAQAVHEAPADAPSSGRVAPQGEPGQPLTVTGTVTSPGGAPIPGASLYIYQANDEGYYGVKPVSDNRHPRLKLFLRSDERGMVVYHNQAWLLSEQPRAAAHSFRSVGARPGAKDLRDRVRG